MDNVDNTASAAKTATAAKVVTADKPVSASKPVSLDKTAGVDQIAKAMTLKELDEKTLIDLRKMAKKLDIAELAEYNKTDLIIKILEEQTKRGGNIFAEGVLEIINDGSHGVLRSLKLLPGANDVYVSGSQIKRFNLRQGDFISGQARAPKEGERYLSLLRIEAINNASPDEALSRPAFQKLTPIFPNKQIKLETEQHILSTRIIDILAPIGKGQRGMLVSPPKVGKTWLLKEIAHGIATNHPEIHLMIVLIGERPEEVTDMERSVNGEVVAANFDEAPEMHTKLAEMAIERAKRLVEQGKDVVILMDSITRLARAYNITAPPSGRTLSGGFDPVAIYPPKKFFGAARNFEERGSLTIIATALVETGSRMDEVIFEEFKGTGNMELKLDRKMSQRRVFPAIDVKASSTRNEEILLGTDVLNQAWRVRRMLDVMKDEEATMLLIERLKKTKNNKEFLATLHEDM
jgi:transcription termination factor Rho